MRGRRMTPEFLISIARRVVNAGVYLRYHGDKHAAKSAREMAYWRQRQAEESTLLHDHYEAIFTKPFQLSTDHFRGKRILDVGCGPRGSLEWATEAVERVGLDPLVEDYRELGIDKHSMVYVNCGAESIPFPDGHFDIVTTINSLDHVDDLDAVIREITRVTKPGGDLLIIVEVGHAPRIEEPVGLWWDDLHRFDKFTVLREDHLEKLQPGIYQSMDEGVPFDHARKGRREAILVARLERHGLAS